MTAENTESNQVPAWISQVISGVIGLVFASILGCLGWVCVGHIFLSVRFERMEARQEYQQQLTTNQIAEYNKLLFEVQQRLDRLEGQTPEQPPEDSEPSPPPPLAVPEPAPSEPAQAPEDFQRFNAIMQQRILPPPEDFMKGRK
jgi:uncharacterized membrane protein YciS (DUF1049 family)